MTEKEGLCSGVYLRKVGKNNNQQYYQNDEEIKIQDTMTHCTYTTVSCILKILF